MKARTIVLTLALCIVGLAVSYAAENPNMGTWKLNEAKSKIPAGMTEEHHRGVLAPQATTLRSPPTASTAPASRAHTEWTGKFDGKAYPVTGDPSWTRAPTR